MSYKKLNGEFVDFFPESRDTFEPSHPSVYYAQGPRRISEPDFIKKEREINKHQEKVTHNETCRCKQYDFNDLVVMYEHIEQYPQFRCYCQWCIDKLGMDCYLLDEPKEEVNHAFKFRLGGYLLVKLGIDLR